MPEKGYYKHPKADNVVWLSCYVYIFAIWIYLTTVNEWLIIFFPKNYVTWKISMRWGEKKALNY